MNTHVDKTQENTSQSIANAIPKNQAGGQSTFQFEDNRPEAVAQRKLQEVKNNSTQASQLKAFRAIVQKRNEGQFTGRGTIQLVDNYVLNNINVRVLDSAYGHMTAAEVRWTLYQEEVTGEILNASLNGTLATWNNRELVADNGYRIRCSWQQGRLVVFHADKGDNYKTEDLKRTKDRYDKDNNNDKDPFKGKNISKLTSSDYSKMFDL